MQSVSNLHFGSTIHKVSYKIKTRNYMGNIIFYSAKQFSVKLKATIQATGKLGFTDETAKELGLSSQTYIKLGTDEDDPDVMYLVVLQEEDDDAFKVCKAGDYFYLPTSVLFMSLGYDFKSKTIIFDITRTKELDNKFNGKVYKLNKRESDKKRKRK